MAETPGTPTGPDPTDDASRPAEGAVDQGAAAPSESAEPSRPAVPQPSPAAPPEASPPAAAPQAEAAAPSPLPQEEVPPPEPAGIAATVRVPPVSSEESEPAAASSEGGEWHLLVSKVREWIEAARLRRQWERLRGPLRALALLIGLILLLRIYGSVVDTIDAIPLISGLLELVGLITVVGFSATRLVRAEERRRVFGEWSRAWQQFRGRL